MRDISRREAMETMLLASAGLTLPTLGKAEAQPAAVPHAFAGQHQPRPLPFDPTRLKGISAKLITRCSSFLFLTFHQGVGGSYVDRSNSR